MSKSKKTFYLIIAGAILMVVCKPIAMAQRGFAAFGGEYLMLVIPFAIDGLIGQYKALLKEIRK